MAVRPIAYRGGQTPDGGVRRGLRVVCFSKAEGGRRCVQWDHDWAVKRRSERAAGRVLGGRRTWEQLPEPYRVGTIGERATIAASTEDPEVVAYAVREGGTIRTSAAANPNLTLEPLLRLTDERESRATRRAARASLRKRGYQSVADAQVAVCADPDTSVWTLRTLADDEDERVASAARAALEAREPAHRTTAVAPIPVTDELSLLARVNADPTFRERLYAEAERRQRAEDREADRARLREAWEMAVAAGHTDVPYATWAAITRRIERDEALARRGGTAA